MVKVTLEVFHCDVCGAEGQRYTVGFHDGLKVLDRCPRHNTKLEALREEKGEWQVPAPRSEFKVSSIDDIKSKKSPRNPPRKPTDFAP